MIKNYFKITLRNLWKHKGFSFLNITGLAIGMTAGFLILLYVGFELSYDTMHSKADRIYRVVADIQTPSEKIEADRPAWAVAPNLEREFPEVEAAVRLLGLDMLVRKDNIKFKESKAVAVDSSFFQIFDFKLIQGDPKNVLKAPFEIVLSKSAAEKYFGGENPVGKTLKIMDEGYVAKVTGIMEDIPENSQIQADVLLSMTTFTQNLQKGLDDQWANYSPAAYILTTTGTAPNKLQSKFPDFLERKNGEEMKESQMFVTLFLEPLKDVYLRSPRGGNGGGNINNVYIFSIVAVFILLIACINFINLTTARSVERAKEVGIRKVVGAEKGQLALQFIGESVIICLIAFGFTLALTALFLPYFNTLAGKTVSDGVFSSPIHMLLLFGISIGIGVLAGIYPAVVLTSFKPVSVLKGRFSSGTSGILLRKILVITQFTISISLIIGTLVIYNQMQYMRNQELGFNKEQIIVLNTGAKPAQKVLKQSLDQMPGILSTSLGSSVPGAGNAAAYSEIENKNGDFQVANLDLYFVDENYIPQFDFKLLAGRAFSKDFATDSTQAMVINEKAVQLLGYSSPKDAIGARFKQWGREGKVIGVIQDFHFRSLQSEIKPLTMRLEPRGTDLIAIKVSPKNISQTLAAIQTKWQDILPDQPFDYYFLNDFFDKQYRGEERFGNLFLNFAVLAIFISCLGLLGLAAYSTMQRRREIGIRKIVGASVSGIVNLLSKEFLKLVGIAFLIASPITWYAMHKWLEGFAYRIDMDWWIFLEAGLLAIIVASATISFQAIKAAIANPVKSLRTE